MPPPLTGYSRVDKETIKAIPPENRSDRYTLATEPEWYMFIAASTATANDDLVLIPNDNPAAGRWHKYGGNRGGKSAIATVICTSQCSTVANGAGKALRFLAPQTIELVIQPGFDINITNTANAIAVYRWNQEPNTAKTGMATPPLISLPRTGGKAKFTIDSTWRWLTFFAKNPSNENFLDCCCVVLHGNTVTLLGYS
jgi:hypothetical protein